MTTKKVIKTNCVGCVWGCGINAYIEDGKLVKVEGMKEHPLSHGLLCPRGEHIIEFATSPDRLKYPLQRKNGSWHKITWDEALDFIAKKLIDIKEKYGARSLAIFCGSVGAENIEIAAFAHRFSNAYGTPNVLSGSSACYRSRVIARNLTFGVIPGTSYCVDDFDAPELAKCIILWGRAVDTSMHILANNINQAIDSRSLNVIVVDPMRTPLAKKGLHLPVRPGADAALALSMMNVIINEDLYDKEFVEKYTVGFDKLAEHVQQYTPEKMAEITWVPAADIKRAARVFAESKPACIITGTCAIDQHVGGFQNNRAISVLMTITGNVDAPGTWTAVPTLNLFNWRLGIDEKPLGYDLYPMYSPFEAQGMLIPDAILKGKPYPIKAMFISAGNPVLSFPDYNKTVEALKKLELLVVHDPFMTETAELAHIVLPACTNFEHVGPGATYWHSSGLPLFALTKKVMEPPGEAWPDWKFFSELGRKMGYEKHFPWKTSEEVAAKWLENTGLTVEQLIETNPEGVFYAQKEYYKYKKGKITTPSGKFEIYSETLAKAGQPPLPVHVEPSQSPISSPELAKKYPLVLTTGPRIPQFSHSQMRSIPSLRSAYPEPLADINPGTARTYGIGGGDIITIETTSGKIKIKAHITEDLAPRIVRVPHGWAEANCNELTKLEPRDPVMAYPELRALLCRIKKV